MTPARWFVSQIGAREHYAVARAFHRAGQLACLYTELWCCCGRGLLACGPAAARALAARQHPELPAGKVVRFTLGYAVNRLAARWRRRAGRLAVFEEYNDIGAWFARRVAAALEREDLGAGDAFFGYDTGMLETLPLLRQRGVLSIVDQIDPGQVERDLVYEESQRWPGWADIPAAKPVAYNERLAEEWRLSSLVLVNSPWSKTALIQQGVPAEKIIVVPLAFEPPTEAAPRPPRDFSGPLHVLWIGSVIIRKGIQYLLAAARELASSNMRFTVAGPLGISQQVVARAPANVRFLGRVTRDQTRDLYRQAHVFVLPTISDGFAITQLEAMAEGVPVITTPNCGEVVTPGVDGMIVPVRDSQALAAALRQLDADRAQLAAMAQATAAKAQQFTLAHFTQRLEAEIARAARQLEHFTPGHSVSR